MVQAGRVTLLLPSTEASASAGSKAAACAAIVRRSRHGRPTSVRVPSTALGA